MGFRLPKPVLNIFEVEYVSEDEMACDEDDERKCSLCGKLFASCFSLKRHVALVHEKLRPFACHLCELTFGERSKLQTHLQTHVSGKSRTKMFPCTLCQSKFKSENYRQQHIKMHLLGNQFTCDACGDKFKHRASLKHHVMRWHTRNKRYACKKCPVKFFVPSDLHRHSLTHVEKAGYQCESCKKTFKQKRYLIAHQRKVCSFPNNSPE